MKYKGERKIEGCNWGSDPDYLFKGRTKEEYIGRPPDPGQSQPGFETLLRSRPQKFPRNQWIVQNVYNEKL